MPHVTLIEHNGRKHVVLAKSDQSLAQASIDNPVPVILADCGGYCNCTTCHCFVDPDWIAILPSANPSEQDMLACAIDPAAGQPNSRLGCQIILTDEMDGLIVLVPASQT
jgi:2Fe-2S ferredoxin